MKEQKFYQKRSQQIGWCETFIANSNRYESAYEIALEELKSKENPRQIIRRPYGMGYEYYKLEDLQL